MALGTRTVPEQCHSLLNAATLGHLSCDALCNPQVLRPSLGPWLLKCTSFFLHCSLAKRPEPRQHYWGYLRRFSRIHTASFLMWRPALPSSALTTPVFFSRFYGIGVTRKAQFGEDEWRGYCRRWTLGTAAMCRSMLTNWLSRGRRTFHLSPLL